MKRRRRLPPDTRPKWNDPGLDIAKIIFISGRWYTAQELHDWCKRIYEPYDSLPREKRDIIKYINPT
jgi:hypothetical protein